MGETGRDALRVGFEGTIKLEFPGAKVSSDAGLFPYRDIDETAQLTENRILRQSRLGGIHR
jgi:hypothetical protein